VELVAEVAKLAPVAWDQEMTKMRTAADGLALRTMLVFWQLEEVEVASTAQLVVWRQIVERAS
jgi:hypothetical protein